MKLQQKLDTLKLEEVPFRLGEIIERAEVEISWYGERLIRVQGFEGMVPLNAVVQKYLSASPSSKDGPALSRRLAWYDLWPKLKQLCLEEKRLSETYLYRYLVPAKDIFFRIWPSPPEPREFLVHPGIGTKFPIREKHCFLFTESDYKRLFGDVIPHVECASSSYVASREMVESASKKQQPNID